MLLEALADGEYHSGEALARAFGVTRAAVWKHAAKLDAWGLAVERAPGRGYRLERPLDLLDRESLRARLARRQDLRLARLDVFTELDSTNHALLAAGAPPPGELSVCMAEFQSAGRGRRGRRWYAPLAAALCLSAGWQFRGTPGGLAALSLAVGVVARRVIQRLGGVAIALKWPNDLVFADRKLGGILVELAAEAHGRCHVVVGIGINVSMPAALLGRVSDWPAGAIDLAGATGGAQPSRESLAAELIVELAGLFRAFETHGFAGFREEWRAADYLCGRQLRVEDTAGVLEGTARGIDADGALLIESATGERRRVLAGDVSVRAL